MVRVSSIASDQVTAWRVRDALAMHPLLGGATAQICVTASYESIILEGWTLDEGLQKLAVKLALRAAGHHCVQPRMHTNQKQHGQL